MQETELIVSTSLVPDKDNPKEKEHCLKTVILHLNSYLPLSQTVVIAIRIMVQCFCLRALGFWGKRMNFGDRLLFDY